MFQAESPVTLLEAISRAQGLREDAGREILVSRSQAGSGRKADHAHPSHPVRGLIDEADPTIQRDFDGRRRDSGSGSQQDLRHGQCQETRRLPVQDGSETTVMEMLALAEGLMPFPATRPIFIAGKRTGSKNEIPVSLDKIMKRAGSGCQS